jgi:hypothetical protein
MTDTPNDIAKVIRADCYCDSGAMFHCPPCKAADEIERLRAALAAVRERGDTDGSAKAMYWIATEALTGATGQPAESLANDYVARLLAELHRYRSGFDSLLANIRMPEANASARLLDIAREWEHFAASGVIDRPTDQTAEGPK